MVAEAISPLTIGDSYCKSEAISHQPREQLQHKHLPEFRVQDKGARTLKVGNLSRRERSFADSA
jgi:hypothetical protein